MRLIRRHRPLLYSLAVALGFSFSQAWLRESGVAAAALQVAVQPSDGVTVGLPPAARREAPATSPGESRWGGSVQCTLTVSAPTYQETQIHTWRMVSGDALPFNRWPAMWSAQGKGTRQTPSNAGTITDNWTIAVAETSAPITIRQRPGTAQIEIRSEHGLLVSQGAINVTSSTGQRLTASIQEWLFPVLEGATSDTRISGSRTRTVGWPGNGWRVPSGVSTEETCVWNLTKGVAGTALAGGTDIEQLVQVVLRDASIDAEKDLRELLAQMQRQRSLPAGTGSTPGANSGAVGGVTSIEKVPSTRSVSLDPCVALTQDIDAAYASTAASLAAAFDAQLRTLDARAAAVNAQLAEIAKQRGALSLQRPDSQSELRVLTLDAQAKEIAKQRAALVAAAATVQAELQKQKQQAQTGARELCENGVPEAARLTAFRNILTSNLQQLASQLGQVLDKSTAETVAR